MFRVCSRYHIRSCSRLSALLYIMDMHAGRWQDGLSIRGVLNPVCNVILYCDNFFAAFFIREMVIDQQTTTKSGIYIYILVQRLMQSKSSCVGRLSISAVYWKRVCLLVLYCLIGPPLAIPITRIGSASIRPLQASCWQATSSDG